MKRRARILIAIMVVFCIVFNFSAIKSEARFIDLKRSGASFNLKTGNNIYVYTKLPGSSKEQKFVARITNFNRISPPSTGTTTSTNTAAQKITVRMRVQVRMTGKMGKKQAKKLLASKHDWVDFMDVVVVDQKTGENLNTSETSAEGINFRGVSVEESEWKGFQPQTVSWSDGTSYQYYVQYFKTIRIDYPTTYNRTCVGVCGTHINDYNKMLDWNEAFTEGYGVFSDTTHVKLKNKKLTAKLSHFLNIK